jgi:hypothetical protein
MPVVGFLNTASPTPFTHLVAAFRKGLEEAGFFEGRNVAIEFRWAEGRYERLPALAAELVQRPVAVLATSGGDPALLAARAATTTIPIVFLIGSDPVELGYVVSFNSPGGNLTGVHQLTAKADRTPARGRTECRPHRRSRQSRLSARGGHAEGCGGGGSCHRPTIGRVACIHRERTRAGFRHLGARGGGRADDRRRSVLQQPARSPGGSRRALSGPDDLRVPGVCGSRRPTPACPTRIVKLATTRDGYSGARGPPSCRSCSQVSLSW